MTLPLWATRDRTNHLVQLALEHKGKCLQGHPSCKEIEHYTHVATRMQFASLPISPADVREGRAIAPYCHGMGIVDLAHAVSDASEWQVTTSESAKTEVVALSATVGPKRVPVRREELSDLYGLVEEKVIDDWKAEDREARSADRWLRQQTAPTGELGRFGGFHHPIRGGGYDPVDVDNYIEKRPAYKIIGYGVNDKMKRFAKVAIPGTGIILHLDVSNSIQETSKTKRKRLRRHGFQVKSTEALCKQAVAIWWAK